jgi:hypothetical protein
MRFTSLLLFLMALLHAPSVNAQTVNWVSTASTAAAGTKSFLSDGTAMPAGFTFELGYFDAGYVAANATTWAASWHALGSTTFNNPAPLFGYNFQANSTVLPANASFVNQQGYIWGFNNLSLMGASGGEALLVTNPTWTFPDPTNPVAFNWSISTASAVVFGAIDKNVGTAGGGVTGDGVISAPKAADTFHMQAATWLAPVPEPSAVGLLAFTGLVGLRRRRH